MVVFSKLCIILRLLCLIIGCLGFAQANLLLAADKDLYGHVLNALPEPSVAENIKNLDTDHDGIVTVYEVRAFVEAKHGKGYKTEVLDDMESSAGGKSCSSPFSKPLY
jgi:hypothetical protein